MTTSAKPLTKPELTVTNVWCPTCGRHKFEPRYTILVCLNCETILEWTKVWGEWFARSLPFELFDDCFPPGTKWVRDASDYGWITVQQYNPNTGEKLDDPKIRKGLMKLKSCLEGKLAQVNHKLEKVK